MAVKVSNRCCTHLSAYDGLPVPQEMPTIDRPMQQSRTPQSTLGNLLEPISNRELEVLHLVAAGFLITRSQNA